MALKVIVIGGTKGIGAAIAKALLNDLGGHFRVVTMARNDANQELDLDWSDRSIAKAVEKAIHAMGGLDILVVSSGMGAFLAPWSMNDARVEQMFQINVMGPIQVYRAALRALMKSKGRVLFIGSTVASHGMKGLSVYAATKAAINGFVLSEARGLKKHGILMNVLSPAWVRTPMTDEMKPEETAKALSFMPGGRMLEPSEVATKALEILTSDRAGEVVEFFGEAT